MRLALHLRALGQGLLDYNYNYFVQGMIYENLAKADAELAARLHASRGPKFFVFSELRFSERRFGPEGIEVRRGDEAKLFVASPNQDFLLTLLEGIIASDYEVKIGPLKWRVEDLQTLRPKYGSLCRTLSPISVSIRENGRIVDLSPTDPRFYAKLAKNLAKKYRLFFGKEYKGDLLFLPEHLISTKAKRIKVKNTYHRAYHFMGLEIVASSEALRLAYDAGVGERNSMGFGMIEGWEGE